MESIKPHASCYIKIIEFCFLSVLVTYVFTLIFQRLSFHGVIALIFTQGKKILHLFALMGSFIIMTNWTALTMWV